MCDNKCSNCTNDCEDEIVYNTEDEKLIKKSTKKTLLNERKYDKPTLHEVSLSDDYRVVLH